MANQKNIQFLLKLSFNKLPVIDDPPTNCVCMSQLERCLLASPNTSGKLLKTRVISKIDSRRQKDSWKMILLQSLKVGPKTTKTFGQLGRSSSSETLDKYGPRTSLEGVFSKEMSFILIKSPELRCSIVSINKYVHWGAWCCTACIYFALATVIFDRHHDGVC